MRNYTYMERQTAMTVGTVLSNDGCHVSPETVYTGSMTTKMRGQADLVIGDHHSPMPYGAWRYDADTFSVSMEKKGSCLLFYPERPGHYTLGASGKASCQAEFLLMPYLVKLKTQQGQYYLVPGEHSNTIISAHNKLLAKLAGGDLDFGESLGEIRESANMMYNAFIKFITFLNHLVHRRWRKAGRVLGIGLPSAATPRNIASMYLAWEFGWRPVIELILDGYEAVKRAFDQDDNRLSCKVRAEGSPSPGTIAYPYVRTGSIIYKVECCAYYRIDNPSIAALRSLNLYNPIQTFWQLRTLSFVYDWVVSVNAFLQGLTATVGLVFEDGYESRTVETDVTLEDYLQLPGYGPTVFRARGKAFQRISLFGFPKPGLRMSLGLDFSKAGTILALLLSRSAI